MSVYYCGRRAFLKTSGLTVALPLMQQAELDAADECAFEPESSNVAKRLICVGSNLGLYRPAFYPKTTGADYQLSPLLAELKEHREHFSVFSGFDHRAGNGHKNWDNYLCGKEVGSQSLDQMAANKLCATNRIPSMQLCAGDIPQQKMAFTEAGVPLPMVNRPSVIFNRLFSSDEDRARSQHLLKSGRSALDLVRQDARILEQSVGREDKEKLQEYFSSLRSLEQRMTKQLDHLANDSVEVDYKLPAFDPIAPTLMLECEQMMFDMMKLALQTDATRVSTLFIAGLGQVFTLDGQTLQAGYHALSHHGNDPDLIRDLIRVEQQHMKCLNRFLADLRSTTDEHGQPLLDSTVVMFGTGMGDASRHSNRDLPTLVAGGGLQHGQHFSADTSANDEQLLGNVYVSILRQLGIEADSFSNATGPVADWS
ncbi:MAG: DUF1552 domain-containing protein [Fuerstiella sp.]